MQPFEVCEFVVFFSFQQLFYMQFLYVNMYLFVGVGRLSAVKVKAAQFNQQRQMLLLTYGIGKQ